MENTKALAELVDNKLAAHYELDDTGKKKVILWWCILLFSRMCRTCIRLDLQEAVTAMAPQVLAGKSGTPFINTSVPLHLSYMCKPEVASILSKIAQYGPSHSVKWPN